jgi:hypothetical protein
VTVEGVVGGWLGGVFRHVFGGSHSDKLGSSAIMIIVHGRRNRESKERRRWSAGDEGRYGLVSLIVTNLANTIASNYHVIRGLPGGVASFIYVWCNNAFYEFDSSCIVA